MSVELFYPDNRKLAFRVEGLLDDIVSIQQELTDRDDDMKTLESGTHDLLTAYARKLGIVSMEDAKKEIAKIVPQEVWDHMSEFLKQRESDNERATNAIQSILIGALVIGRVNETVHAFRLMASKATLAEGLEKLSLIPRKIKQMAKFWEQGHEGTTVLRAAKWVQRISSLVEKLGIALDLVLIISAAIEGAEQRKHLVKGVQNLFTRRILVKMVLMQAEIPMFWISTISAIVTIRKYSTTSSSNDEAVRALEESVLAGMEAQKNQLMFDYVYGLLKAKDDAGHAFQDYDPTLPEAKAFADTLDADTNTMAMSVGRSNKDKLLVSINPTLFSLSSTSISKTFSVTSDTMLGPAGEPDGMVFKRNELTHLIPEVDDVKLTIRSMDIFWPDNPKRKARAQELYDDIKWTGDQLTSIKAGMDSLGTELKPNLDAAMKAMGLDSFDALEAEITRTCSSEDVAKWKQAKDLMDETDKVQATIFGVVNICAAGVGVVGLGMTFVFPPLGVAMVEIAAMVEVGAALLQGLLEILEGELIRDECRRAIHQQLPERVQARVAYEKMEIMMSWMETVNTAMKAFEQSMSREEAAKLVANLHLVSEQLAVKFQRFGPDDALQTLRQLDNDRQSWTDEDWW